MFYVCYVCNNVKEVIHLKKMNIIQIIDKSLMKK